MLNSKVHYKNNISTYSKQKLKKNYILVAFYNETASFWQY